jgi:hypothetical protein
MLPGGMSTTIDYVGTDEPRMNGWVGGEGCRAIDEDSDGSALRHVTSDGERKIARESRSRQTIVVFEFAMAIGRLHYDILAFRLYQRLVLVGFRRAMMCKA